MVPGNRLFSENFEISGFQLYGHGWKWPFFGRFLAIFRVFSEISCFFRIFWNFLEFFLARTSPDLRGPGRTWLDLGAAWRDLGRPEISWNFFGNFLALFFSQSSDPSDS